MDTLKYKIAELKRQWPILASLTYREGLRASCFLYPTSITNVKSGLTLFCWKTSWTYKAIAKRASYSLIEG